MTPSKFAKFVLYAFVYFYLSGAVFAWMFPGEVAGR